MRGLHKICYTVCMACVAFAAIAGIGIVWMGAASDVAWRSLGTVAIVFVASLAFVVVDMQFSTWIQTLSERRRVGPATSITPTTVVQYPFPPQKTPDA